MLINTKIKDLKVLFIACNLENVNSLFNAFKDVLELEDRVIPVSKYKNELSYAIKYEDINITDKTDDDMITIRRLCGSVDGCAITVLQYDYSVNYYYKKEYKDDVNMYENSNGNNDA